LPAFRSPVALSDAITRDLVYRIRLGTVIGSGAAIAVWLLSGFLLFEERPTVDDAALGAVGFLVVSLIAFAFPLVRSGRERHALETVYWAAGESSRRWGEAFGDGRVPANPKQALAWLARHPEDTDATRHARVFAKLVIGDLAAARELVARLPAASPVDRFRREASAAMVRMVEGGDPDVDGLASMVDSLPDEADRFQAQVDLGMLRGLLAAGDGGDWMAPMLALRERLDGRADGALRLMWLPVAAMLAIGAVLLAAGAYAIRSLVGDTIGPG
jgi:hypothetical protein